MPLDPSKLTFLQDRECFQGKQMGLFLKLLDENFLALNPDAEMQLKNHVAEICQFSYETQQSWFRLWRKGADMLGMGIEESPDIQ